MAKPAERRLAAIMFADMVGYTALMEGDEDRARAQRDRHRAIISAAAQRHRGRVRQHYGDGTLCVFGSAVEAVLAAMEVQAVVAGEPLIPLRIGVHSGDIVDDGEGIYGDGVNLASRIEALSAPGGIMVSGKVFDEIKNHPSISTVPIGAVRLKNVGRRVNVFAVSNEGLSVPIAEEVREKSEATRDDASDLPLGLGEAFLKRVRDRAILQWTLVYAATAWVVVQATRFGADLMHWSPMVSRGASTLAFVGLFVTLVVSWYHGEKGRQTVKRTEVVLIAMLLLVAAGSLSLLSRSGRRAGSEPSRPLQGVALSKDRPSVAVLPWVNRSGLSEDAYLADGIHDEVLTRLSKIAGLRVISRPSVMQFRNSSLTDREIAAELGVRYILQAGLLRVGDTIRVNVQLLDARTADLRWAATYDRHLTLETLLSIQAEVAQTIADTLRAEVTPEERVELERFETDNLQAYDFYLQGREYYLRPGYQRENFEAAVALFERAIELDPRFALAHAALSRAHGSMYWERFDPSQARLDAQRNEASEALRLQPSLPQAHVAMGSVDYVAGDYAGALQEYLAARRGLPGDGDIVARIGYTYRRLGNWDGVFAAFEEASSLNPRDATLFYDLGGHSYARRRRYAEAVGAYNQALDLAPDLYDAALRKGDVFVHWQGRLDTLRAVVSSLPGDLHTPEIDLARADLALKERRGGALLQVLADVPAPAFETQLVYLPKPLYVGWAYRFLGREDRARAAFDSARAILEPLARARPDDERVSAALGYVYAALGRAAEAAARADWCVRASRKPGSVLTQVQAEETAARILAQAGLAEQAVEQLQMLLEGDSPVSVYTLRLDPLYNPIRGTEIFEALLAAHAPPSGA